MEDSAGLAGDALSRDVLGDIGCLWEKYHYSDSDICFRMAGFDLSNIVKNYQLKNFPLHRVLVVTLHIENLIDFKCFEYLALCNDEWIATSHVISIFLSRLPSITASLLRYFQQKIKIMNVTCPSK